MTGDDLKQLRDRRGLSQQALADLLNGALDRRYASSTVSQWEAGKRKVPAGVAAFLDQLALAEALPPDPAAPPVGAGDAAAAADIPPGDPGAAPPPSGGMTALGPTGTYTRVCTELWELIGTLLATTGAVLGNQALVVDGMIIDADKAALGRAYGRLAETNETFRKLLVGATTSGAWFEVAIVTTATASKLLSNHAQARLAHGPADAAADDTIEPVYAAG